jgi:hypothetical protein
MAWSEIIIEGPRAAATAFVTGYLAAGNHAVDSVVWEHEAGLTVGSFVNRIATMLSAERHHGVFAPARLASAIASAIDERGNLAELRLERLLTVVGVRFAFRAEAFAEDLAAELRDVIADLPAGTVLESIAGEEETDTSAEGVELYSPRHDFRFRIAGRVRSDDGAALVLLKRLHVYDAVKFEDVEIETA